MKIGRSVERHSSAFAVSSAHGLHVDVCVVWGLSGCEHPAQRPEDQMIEAVELGSLLWDESPGRNASR